MLISFYELQVPHVVTAVELRESFDYCSTESLETRTVILADKALHGIRQHQSKVIGLAFYLYLSQMRKSYAEGCDFREDSKSQTAFTEVSFVLRIS